MNKQKRMFYIYEENLDFYDSLENKSAFINEKLRLAAKASPVKDNTDPNWHPDPRIRETRARVAKIDARNNKLHEERQEERKEYVENQEG